MLLIFWLFTLINAGFCFKKLETVYEWKYIDYLWDADLHKQQYIDNGDYDYRNIVPIDVDKARDGRVFVTAIRDRGVPASLGTIANFNGPSGPLIKPYPDWSWYKKGDCNGITSVYRIAMDECNRLYVLDTGYIGDNYTCPAQVLIFNLTTDRLLERFKIPDSVAQNVNRTGKLVTPVIQTKGPNCELQNLFMADVNGYGLVIMNKYRTYRLESELFNPEERYSNVTIAGESFTLLDSLMGMALSQKPSMSRSDLIFRPFASVAMYTADTRVLERSTRGDTIRYRQSHDMLPSQATAMGVSADGTLFFGLTADTALGCWDTDKDMSRENVVIAARDNERLQFASGLKVIPSSRTGGHEEVWMLTNRLQKIMAGTQNFNESNFRVLKGSVENLVKNTNCQPSQRYDSKPHPNKVLQDILIFS